MPYLVNKFFCLGIIFFTLSCDDNFLSYEKYLIIGRCNIWWLCTDHMVLCLLFEGCACVYKKAWTNILACLFLINQFVCFRWWRTRLRRASTSSCRSTTIEERSSSTRRSMCTSGTSPTPRWTIISTRVCCPRWVPTFFLLTDLNCQAIMKAFLAN